jgi:S-adenosyl-L-methionine hydrolase (adenosine-forming)
LNLYLGYRILKIAVNFAHRIYPPTVPIITLLTDLGLKDSYLPQVKGEILRELPDANIVDISHEVQPFNIGQAAFILGACYSSFPPGTIHLTGIDADQQLDQKFVAVRTNDYVFLGYDNGLVSLVFREEDIKETVHLNFQREDLVFPLKNVLVPAAVSIAKGQPLSTIGTPGNYRMKANLRPVMEESIIRAMVVYNDRLGNAITNLHRDDLLRYGENRKLTVYISKSEVFSEIHTHYTEVPEGEKLCLFNTQGYLEIAINKSTAAGLLGLKPGHTVLIEFL